MPSTTFSRACIRAFLAAIVMASVSSAFAQDSFTGTWAVADFVRPDWIEHTSPPPVVDLRKGVQIAFRAGSVDAPEPFGCANASYEVVTVDALGLFQGGIADPVQAQTAARQFGLSGSGSTRTLRVTCESSFDYHENSAGNLVIQYDNMLYILARVQAK